MMYKIYSSFRSFVTISVFQIYMENPLDLFLTRLCLEKRLSASFPLAIPQRIDKHFAAWRNYHGRTEECMQFPNSSGTHSRMILQTTREACVKHSLCFLVQFI